MSCKLPVAFLLFVSLLSGQPRDIIFTYTGDPSTSICVNWQVDAAPADGAAVVRYDKVSRAGEPERYKQQATGEAIQIDGLEARTIYRVSLSGLKPSKEYYLVVGDEATGYSKELKIRTIPDDDRPLRFVTGGDMGTGKEVRTLLKHSASYEPAFAVIGGDIAYANGKIEQAKRWDIWLQFYSEEMVTPDGFSIPAVLAIGNHEVNGGFNQSMEKAPFYFGYFGQDGEKSYFTRQFGSLFGLLVLDSGHITPHEAQVDWLRNSLASISDLKYRAAVYHVPLYPSHRPEEGRYSVEGRRHWAPLFDEFELTVAFENHDHTFKRSHHLRGNAVVEAGEGTLYLGDGCWGRGPRTVEPELRWYLAKAAAKRHFWLVDVEPQQMHYRAVNAQNEVFDTYKMPELAAQATKGAWKPHGRSTNRLR